MCKRDWTYLPVWKCVCGDRSGSEPWAVLISDSASPSFSTSLWHAFKRAVPTKRPIQSNFHCFSFEIPGEPDSWILSNESQETSPVICSSVSSRSIKSSAILMSAASFLFFFLFFFTQSSIQERTLVGRRIIATEQNEKICFRFFFETTRFGFFSDFKVNKRKGNYDLYMSVSGMNETHLSVLV